MSPACDSPIVFGAIDVGTNAARLKLAHYYPEGRLVPFYKQRAPIRPGEGVFTTGLLAPTVADRLVATLAGFMRVCGDHGARVRAVATSSLRNARNAPEVLARILTEANVRLEVISGEEEARLICMGVLDGRPEGERSLVIDIGGGSTEIILARGDTPLRLWSLPLGTVRLTEQFRTARRVSDKRLTALRGHIAQVVHRDLNGMPRKGLPQAAYGSSGTIKALARYIGPRRSSVMQCQLLSEATEALSALKMRQRRRHFAPGRADIIVAGSAILEGLAMELQLEHVRAVEAGLRDGLLVAQRREAVMPGMAASARREPA